LLPAFIASTSFGQYLIHGSGLDLATGAALTFSELGTNAACAIPALQVLIKDSTRPRTAGRAISVLSNLGSPARDALLGALSDTNHPYRDLIVTYSAVFMSLAPDTGTNAILPHLQAVLDDPDPAVRLAASRQLNRLSPKPPTNTPAADPGN
jgi:HEAT repeat protein